MTDFIQLRPFEQKDHAAIEHLALNKKCVRWGGLPQPTRESLSERWQQPQVTPAFIQVAENSRGVLGYSDVFLATPRLAISHGLAENLDVVREMISWTCQEAKKQDIVLQTFLAYKEPARTTLENTTEDPMHALLVEIGFTAFSTTRRLRLQDASPHKLQPLPQMYRFESVNESLLPSLMDAYFESWPEDYYRGEEADEIANEFREALDQDLLLVVNDRRNVVGYVRMSSTPEQGVIDEVAVLPNYRRKGLGEALVRTAIQSLGKRTIELVVLDENPVLSLYDRLGFIVVQEHINFVLSSSDSR